jgi:hypothetical protein
MNGAGAQPSPPLDFPIYGLDSRWWGPRWLDFFEALPSQPAWAVWLGHRTPDGLDEPGGLRVGTFARQRYEATMCPRGQDPLAAVALGATLGLVNLTLPDVSVPRPDGLISALVDKAEEMAKAHADWPRVHWDVDGMPAPAAVWEFAGAWAGFTAALPDAYVAVVGIGVPADGLRLVPVRDEADYRMDLRAPLDLAELGRQKGQRPDSWLPPPRRDGFHADQLAVAPRDQPA